jgi:hypothetical protein
MLVSALLAFAGAASGQAIQFESNGLQYMTLTRDGLTLMFAELPIRVRGYAILQVAVSNGSPSNRTVKPEDFEMRPDSGVVVKATSARTVVENFLGRAGRNDVMKLVSMYEVGLYGLGRYQSTNGYEQRRQAALAEVDSSRLKAAAAASAIALVQTRLKPGEATDGAIFFALAETPIAPGKLVANIGAVRFEFSLDELRHPGELVKRP